MNLKLAGITVSLVTVFAVNSALADVQYFGGIDAGVHDGKIVRETGSDKSKSDTNTDPVLGIRGGAIVNGQHRFTVGADYKAIGKDKAPVSESLDVATGYLQYDYLVPLSQHVTWSIGPRIGYEKWVDSGVTNDLNGLVYGGQTGVEYRTGNWGIGAEAIYFAHDAEAKWQDGSVSNKSYLDNETQLKVSANYYF